MGWLGGDVDEELRGVSALQQARARGQAAADLWDAAGVLRLANIAKAAPWIRPGVLLALAIGTSSPSTIRNIASMAARAQVRRNPSNRRAGQLVSGAQLVPGHRALFHQAQQYVGQQARQAAQGGAPADDIGDALGRLQDAGFVRDGVVYEPKAGSRDRPVFAELERQLDAAGENFEFMDSEGQPVKRYGGYEDYTYTASSGKTITATSRPGKRRIIDYDPRTDPKRLEAAAQRLATAGPTGIAAPIRALTTVANAPIQELTGAIRNVYGEFAGKDPNWFESQSDLGIQFSNPNLEAGGGFFVSSDSEIAAERRRREADRGLISGHRITPGRLLAEPLVQLGVIDADTQPYRVLSGLTDATFQIVADPTALGAARLSKVAAARKLFAPGDETLEATGLIRGAFRGDAHGPTANAWMDGAQGSKVIEALAAEPSPSVIWQSTNRKLDGAEVTRLADANTTDEVREVLRPLLGQQFRSTDDVWAAPQVLGIKRTIKMTPNTIDLEDPRSALVQTERWLQAAHFSDEDMTPILDRVARAKSRNEVFGAVEEAMSSTNGVLAQAGIGSPALRREATRLFRESEDRASLYFVDQAGDRVPVWDDVAVGDKVIPGIGPQLSVEHIGRFIPLPSHREIRKLTAKYPNLTKLAPDGDTPLGQAVRAPGAFLDHLMNDFFKPTVLLRAGWPLRVVGDEQLRMATAGLVNMSTHPISFMSWAIGRTESGRATRFVEDTLERAPGVHRRGGLDALGTPFEEGHDFAKGLVSRRGVGGWFEEAPGRVPTGRYVTYGKNDKGFEHAFAEELAVLRIDPVARKIVQVDDLDAAEDWFVNSGPGREILEELTDAHPQLANPGEPRRYLESVSKRIDIKTGGNVDLLDAIRTGKLDGERILVDDIRPSPHFIKKLGTDYIDGAPDVVKGMDSVYLKAHRDRFGRRVVDALFAGLMTRETNYLSRSPMFRQSYWQRTQELIGFGDAAAKAKILQAARDTNLPSSTIRRMERTIPKGQLNVDEIDALSKGFGLDETKRLLYDLSERSQIADSMRLVAPFGEAWREVITRWGTLVREHPQVLRRVRQGIEGARGEDFGETTGAPDGKGFFWRNEFGEEVFLYPGSQWIMANAPGGPHVPIPLVGRVQGLNMMGQILPGLGPVAAVPVSWFLPDRPGWERDLRELLLPFGTPGEEGFGEITQLLNLAPPWMRRAVQAATGGGFDEQSNRVYANATMEIANYLYSTGKYDTSTPAGVQALMADAKQNTEGLYLIRALASFGAPSAPSPDFLWKAPEGLVRLAMLRDDYYTLAEDVGFEEATAKFVERYGSDIQVALTSKSRALKPGLESTTEFADWREANSDLVADYPNSYGVFGPQGGEFDYAAYLAEINRGEREALEPDEWRKMWQTTLGWERLDRIEATLGPRDDWEEEDFDLWAAAKEAVRSEYPGWMAKGGLEEKAYPDTLFAEFGRAVTDQRVLKTSAGRALARYWRQRELTLEVAEDEGVGLDARAMDGDREALRQIGEALAREHPEFEAAWSILKREVDDD